MKWDDCEKSIANYDKDEFLKIFHGTLKASFLPFKSLNSESCGAFREAFADANNEHDACQWIKENFNLKFTKKCGIVKARYRGLFDELSKEDIEKWVTFPQWIKLLCRDKLYNTLAHVVCKRGYTELIPHFLTKENCQFQNSYYSTPLHRAVKSNSLECVKAAIEYGGLVQLQDSWWYWPWNYCQNQEITDYFDELFKDPQNSTDNYLRSQISNRNTKSFK